ncbi:hypothetical protein D770_04790 [Flammeovirgaceae bacterium 311]|nr:hypothetical protein D770_04790 [Flammeovirgaceae bacterium 311]
MGVFDISSIKDKKVSYEDLEGFYQEWLQKTGRDNNLDEYGMFLDVISYLKRNQQMKYALMVVDTVNHYA